MGSTHRIQLVLPLTFMMLILALSALPEIAGQTISSSGFEPGRNLLQTDNVSEPVRQSDDTVRVDPLDNFKKYRGGYDITNKHYWSSTIFTGIYGYCAGLLWLLCGTLYGGFLLATAFFCRSRKIGKLRKRLPYKQCCLRPILLVTLFTILAITASGLVLGANARFHSRAKTVVNIIMNTANEASETIYNTTGAMKDITNNLGAAEGSSDASGFLTSTSEKLNVKAAEIQREAKKNRHLIDKGLRIVYIITTVTISFNLVAVIALSVSGSMRFRRALYLFIILCWSLTVLCWLFSGMYFFLEKFSSDTCTALENFQENPTNNSLSSILPCDEVLSAKSVLFDVSAGIYNLVNEVNVNISLFQATSNTNLRYVCNPFSAPPDYQYQPDNCPANTIRIRDIPKVLKFFTCSEANNGTCENDQLLSNSNYKIVEAYSNSIQSLLDAYPGMESLVECQSVKDAFSEILFKHCKPLKRYVRMVWVSMLFLSVIMMILVLIWMSQAHHEQNLDLSNGSVKPHIATGDMLEAGATEEVNSHTKSSTAYIISS
ncbi:hypothetical protein I3843_01G087100 [Carya illinoinensis]|nr:hypothetical protein I3842_01G092100 [Carya illinoinensis]KAG6730666.1 hypothetical protein I3842_01G092100 [Carya illinoinensis]KAG6730667.1 hypothetical protein I3842_01G092100 [Carya illinoinensis]KAG6730670.1 hypothetical protein I3842_01G092100 [Carya illinoinensis]KAG7995010.1 hypothetical protein I3843_01G087100 [Carya illinoinensis]